MKLINIATFAADLDVAPQRLLDQLKAAGIPVHQVTDTVSEGDKMRLLSYLRSCAGSGRHVLHTPNENTVSTAGINGILSTRVASLTQAQLEFLRQYNVPTDRVYDATGKTNAVWQADMKVLGAWVAYGVSPCNAEGHTMRTRKGHCVQCNPENLSYLKRFDQEGEVYVAESLRGGLVKVGTSNDAAERVGQLNTYGYGSRSDWFLRFKVIVRKAGRVEAVAHQNLAEYVASGTYFKNGGFITSREIFSCTGEQAIAAVQQAASQVK